MIATTSAGCIADADSSIGSVASPHIDVGHRVLRGIGNAGFDTAHLTA
jgi:hypothetical protein